MSLSDKASPLSTLGIPVTPTQHLQFQLVSHSPFQLHPPTDPPSPFLLTPSKLDNASSFELARVETSSDPLSTFRIASADKDQASPLKNGRKPPLDCMPVRKQLFSKTASRTQRGEELTFHNFAYLMFLLIVFSPRLHNLLTSPLPRL
jgi:hypothetical protein